MQKSLNQLLSRDFDSKNRCSVGHLVGGLLAFLGMAGLAGSAQAETTYRWWNPNGSPETGFMNDSPNWEDFILPSLHPEAQNRLVFKFANDGSFEAINNLRDYLSVSSLYRGPSTLTGTACISGLPLRLTSPDGEKVEIENYSYDPMVIKTPLGGSGGLSINGRIRLDPANSAQHNFSGGIEVVNGNSALTISSDWHLGSPSNSVEMLYGGVLHIDAPIDVAHSINCGSGLVYTDTVGTVTLSQFSGDELTQKAGPGTLRIPSASEAPDRWVIREGTLEAGPGVIDDSDILGQAFFDDHAPGLRLIGDAVVEVLEFERGFIDLNGFTMEMRGAYINSTTEILGSGVLRAVGPENVYFYTEWGDFNGVIESRGAPITLFLIRGMNSELTLSVPQASDLINIRLSNTVTVGLITGDGTIIRDSTSPLNFGKGGGQATLSGKLQTNGNIVKIGSSEQSLTGVLELGTSGLVTVNDGELRLSQLAADGVAKIKVGSSGTFSPHGNVNVPLIEGSGTVALNSQTLTIGESDLSFRLSGTLTGNIETSTLRKRGTGTLTLSADTTGFGGFFQINGGAVRFTGGTILPAAASLTVFGEGQIRGYGELSRPFWNTGTVAADSSSGVLRLSGQDQWNNGTIKAENGGSLELDGVFLEQDFSGSLVQGSLESDETPIRLIGDNPTIVQGGTIETTGTGSLELIGTAITLREVDHSGHLSLRSGVDITAEDFDIVMGAAHILDVEFEPDADDSDGAIRGHGTATLGGALRVVFPDGYIPVSGDAMTIIGGGDTGGWTIDESFETIEVPDVSPLLMRVESNAESMRLVITCAADLAAPFGALDIFDVIGFIAAFNAGEPSADFDGVPGLDIFDVISYLEAFNLGCS